MYSATLRTRACSSTEIFEFSVLWWGCVMGESSVPKREPSSFHRGKFAPKNIQYPKQRISFRDLARFASPRKTEQFLSSRTGKDESSAKRWLSGKSRAPASAVYAVLADIFARID